MDRRFPTALALALLAPGFAFADSISDEELTGVTLASDQASAEADAALYVPGEVLVQFKGGASELDRGRAMRVASGRVKEHIHTGAMKSAGQAGLSVASVSDVKAALRALRKDPSVLFAEPNYFIEPMEVSNDPSYTGGGLWGTYGDDQPSAAGPANTTNVFGSRAEKSWAAGKVGAKEVFIGILDEGVALTHADLDGNIWVNPFDPIDGIDNDGNRFIDDSNGWDFFNSNSGIYDGGATGTEDKHGTHVAGTIGAEGGNAAGIAGVAWRVTMIPAKIMGPGGGSTAEAVKAFDYLTDLKVRHRINLVAINNSWSSTGYTQSLNDAVLRAAKQNILIICAAGNDATSNDTTPRYPASFDTTRSTSTQSAASYDAVISVAAIDRYGALASFSNTGATSVDIGAPGVSITSTLPPATYGGYSGTSMACPHVTGAAALYAASHPGALATEIRQAILSNAIATPSLAGKCVTGGRLDASFPTAVQPPPPPPPPAVVHDVAVTVLSVPSPSQVGSTRSITVTVKNEGTASETFTVSVTDTPPLLGRAGTLSAPRSVTLAAGGSQALAFTWNLVNATTGAHAIRASATTVAGETDTADNARSATGQVNPFATPAVTSITPTSALRGASFTMTVYGSGFASGARVNFQYGSGPLPVSGTPVVATDGKSLRATVSVPTGTLLAPGVWDVLVTNPDARNGRKVDAFTVRVN